MSKSKLVMQANPEYCVFELPKKVHCDSAFLKELKLSLEKHCLQQSRKAVVYLPNSFEIESGQYPAFSRFLQKHMHGQLLFTPQKESSHWGKGWRHLWDDGLLVAESFKAVAWATHKTGEKNSEPTVRTFPLADTLYIKCSGALHQDPGQFKAGDTALANARFPAKILAQPAMVQGAGTTAFSFLKAGVVVDISEIFWLNAPLLQALKEWLSSHHCQPGQPGVYFVTSGLFQSWLLSQGWEGAAFLESGNIIRVVADNQGNDGNEVGKEADYLGQICQETSLAQRLFVHQVSGPQQALEVANRYFPELIIVDELNAADALEKELPDHWKEKLYRVTPSADPRVRILSSQLITQGYDLRLFAEYLVSRYQNRRGRPNDTSIYYLDAHPDSLKKVITLLLVDFGHILDDHHKKLLESLAQCETQASSQGSLLVSLLDEKLLNFKLQLPFTNAGGIQLFSRYAELFPDHYNPLSGTLRLFVKNDAAAKTIVAKFQVVQDLSEITIQSQGFTIETRFQPGQAMLTLQAKQDQALEKLCFAFVSILNAGELFQRLPDKEILIELISLIWETSKIATAKSKDKFLLTLQLTPQTTEIKICQSAHNKILLKEQEQDGLADIQLIGDTLYSAEAQKRLLKIMSLFFTKNAQDQTESSWKFALFETLPQIISRTSISQEVSFDFKMAGIEKTAVLLSNAPEPLEVSPRSRKIMESGADQVIVATQNRQITLLKNPAQERAAAAAEEVLAKKLENLQATAILQQVEDAKAKETAATNAKLRDIYDQALSVYNKKFGDAPDEAALPKHGPKTMEMALQTKVVRSKELNTTRDVRRRVLQRAIPIVIGLTVIMVGVVLYLFNKTIPPGEGSGIILTELPPQAYVPPEVVRVTKAEPIPADLAQDLINLVIQGLLSEAKPSQNELNRRLKSLYLKREAMVDSGDLQNMIGRLFLYKIYLDRETKLFKKEWIVRWRTEAIAAWENAKKLYNRGKQSSKLKLPVYSWMPEKFLPMGQEGWIQYSSQQKAVADMDYLLRDAIKEVDRLLADW